MIAALYLAATSKVRSRFPFLSAYTVGNGVVNFWHILKHHSRAHHPLWTKAFFTDHEKEHIWKYQAKTEFSLLLCFFTEIMGEEKFQVEKKYRIYKVFIFFVSRIYCLVFLIEVLKLKLRYGFVENFTALLLKREFVLGDLRNRSGSKNTETEFTVNFYFLWSIFLSL